jgi:hypothetical protein
LISPLSSIKMLSGLTSPGSVSPINERLRLSQAFDIWIAYLDE